MSKAARLFLLAFLIAAVWPLVWVNFRRKAVLSTRAPAKCQPVLAGQFIFGVDGREHTICKVKKKKGKAWAILDEDGTKWFIKRPAFPSAPTYFGEDVFQRNAVATSYLTSKVVNAILPGDAPIVTPVLEKSTGVVLIATRGLTNFTARSSHEKREEWLNFVLDLLAMEDREADNVGQYVNVEGEHQPAIVDMDVGMMKTAFDKFTASRTEEYLFALPYVYNMAQGKSSRMRFLVSAEHLKAVLGDAVQSLKRELVHIGAWAEPFVSFNYEEEVSLIVTNRRHFDRYFDMAPNVFFRDAIKLAQTGAQTVGDEHHHDRYRALQLFEALVEKQLGIPEALATADIIIRSNDTSVRYGAIDLLKPLLVHSHRLDTVAAVAQRWARSDSEYVREAAMDVFASLANHFSALRPGVAAAVISTRDPSPRVRDSALKLLFTLVDKNVGFKEAEDAATLLAGESDSMSIRCSLLRMTVRLMQGKGHGEKLSDIMLAGFRHNSSTGVQQDCLKVLDAFFNRDLGFRDAIAVANSLLEGDDEEISYYGVEVYLGLFARGKGFTEAIIQATRGLTSTTLWRHNMALHLFSKLFRLGYGYAAARGVVRNLALDSDDSVRSTSRELLRGLFMRAKGIEMGLEVAEALELAGNQSLDMRQASLHWYSSLIKNGPVGATKAIAAAKRGIDDNDGHVRAAAMQLFFELQWKRHSIDEALAAAQRGIKDRWIPVVIESINIFKQALLTGRSMSEVKKACKVLIRHPDKGVQKKARKLWAGVIFAKNSKEYMHMVVESKLDGDPRPNLDSIFFVPSPPES